MLGKRIVITTVGSEGDLRPLLALGCELQRRGHRVVIATHRGHAERVAEAELTFADASGLPDNADMAELAARAFRFWRGPRFVVRDLAAADVRDSHARLSAICADADLLVTTTLAFAGQILAEQCDLRWVSVVLAPAGFLSAFEPPVTGLSMVDRYVRGSAPRGRGLRRWAERLSRRWTAPVRAFRRELALPAVSQHGDPFHSGQHAPQRVLAMFSPVLGEPQPDWPSQVRQTGFAFHRPEGAALGPELATFLDAGAPPLVFTLGSTAVHIGGRFLRESVQAVRALGARAVLLTGSAAMRAQLPDPLPAGMLAVDYAPHALLFPRAAAVIHHGGVGTSAEALRAGRPMLVVPHGFDQPDNAARLQRLGVAEVLPARRYRAGLAAPLLRRLLDAPHYRRKAMTLAQRLAGEAGAAEAADVIEAALRD